MIKVTPELEAIVAEITAAKASARAIVLRYLDESKIVSIGEHPDIKTELAKAFKQWTDAHDLLEGIEKFAKTEDAIQARLEQNKSNQEDGQRDD